MQVTSLLTQQVPQLLLGASGKVALAGVNIAGGAGRQRSDIEEAYEKTFKENPEQLLKLPEIQERMAQGMTLEQAVNDAKTDVSDNWKSILTSALLGGTEALSPLGKFGQGVNRGVLKTLGKEVGQEALQEGAEQLNSNLAVGEIDGKTGAFDEVVRNATLGAVAGLGTGIPTAIEAGLNGRTESDADIDQILNRSAEGAKTANAQAKAQGESQQANSTNTQSTTGQSSVDEQILESVVSEVTDEELRSVNKPIVAALHLKQTQQGLELINIASVYGRNNSQIQRGLENDLLYWNKEKGAKFLDNLTLQLRSPLSENSSIKGNQLLNNFSLLEADNSDSLRSSLLNADRLVGLNIKTEADLSQYQFNENSRNQQKSQSVLTSFGLQSPTEKSQIGSIDNVQQSTQQRNPQITQDQQTLSRIQQGINDIAKVDQNQTASVNNGVRYSLNEDPSSEFAKAVDTVAQGGKPSKQYVPMGTTPNVLKMLGVEDTKVLINRDVLNKVMLNKHNVTPETLKQLPKQINDPVAVMTSAPQATQQGYVVLTELVEENALTGENEPVISALHLKSTKDGMEVINIASVYGKNLRGMQNMLNHDLLYWHKEKGSQFIDAFGLQLPAKIASNDVSQSASDIKTNDDLSQYQSENSDDIRID